MKYDLKGIEPGMTMMLPGFEEKPPELTFEQLRATALACEKCRLSATRFQVIWGQGDPNSPLMVVGQGPSVSDDRTGDVYSGPAGDELNEVLRAVGLRRDQIYLTNCHKCVARDKNDPYNIRAPIKAELNACKEWLDGEFRLVKPKILLCIGSPAAKWLLGDQFDLTKQRGLWQPGPFGTQALATYQPSYVNRLRQHQPEQADLAWATLISDFKAAAQAAGFAP